MKESSMRYDASPCGGITVYRLAWVSDKGERRITKFMKNDYLAKIILIENYGLGIGGADVLDSLDSEPVTIQLSTQDARLYWDAMIFSNNAEAISFSQLEELELANNGLLKI